MFTLVIQTWVNGVPTVVREIPGFVSKTQGIERLRNIGHAGDYDMRHAGYLNDDAGKRVAQLDIFRNTYRVTDLEETE